MNREAARTLRLPRELPASSFKTVNAFPGLSFTNPVSIVTAPGDTTRLFVVERAGVVLVITNLASPTRSVFLNIRDRVDSDYRNSGAEGLADLVFHPAYKSNGQFFVVYTTQARTAAGTGRHNRLARFTLRNGDPNRGDENSHQPILTQKDEGYGHNWNDLAFGPDGYLYMACGDEGDSRDQYQNSQRIDKDFFSGIFRIDVDRRPQSLPPNPHPAINFEYGVPPDNPFIGVNSFNGLSVDPQKVRSEFYAFGLRNPWRMCIDPATGAIYAADVGQHGREEINLIVKGGNYGWAYREGTAAGFKGEPPPGIQLIPPLYEYTHAYTGTNAGTSVTGGLVYRGSRFPELAGAYLFGDFTTGNIWALRHNGNQLAALRHLTANAGIAGFGEDPRNGDVLMADHDEGIILRLEAGETSSALPPTLADTGIFSNVADLVPNKGVIPYEINVPFWSDHATKKRWFALPEDNMQFRFERDDPWQFPAGMVWVKHFELPMAGQAPKRLETRVLVRTGAGMYGVTYRWNGPSNATLVPAEGASETLQIPEGAGTRPQTWRYPSRSECLSCHTSGGGWALGFNTAQLNRVYPSNSAHQIQALAQSGYLADAPAEIHLLPRMVNAADESASLGIRVRSYLAANCAQCHYPGGPGYGMWDARFKTAFAESGLLHGAIIDQQGNAQAKLVTPGSLENSMLYKRIASLGPGHMPPLATEVLDANGIDLVRRWILEELPRFETYESWRSRLFGQNSDGGGPEADPDQDGASNLLEYLTATDPVTRRDPWTISIEPAGDHWKIIFPQIANRYFQVEWAGDIPFPASWRPLNVPGNEPFLTSTNRIWTVIDPAPAQQKFYRVRVSPP